MAEFSQLATQFLEILDYSVVNHGDAGGGMGMGIDFVGHAMGRPTRVTDADGAVEGLGGQARFQVDELAFGAAAIDRAVNQGGDSS